jgi:hypothetical protein
VLKTYGLDPLDDFWDQVRHARKILVMTSPAFDFPAQIPDNVRYVGPVLDDPNYREAAKRLGASIRADADSDTLVSELER